MQNFWKKNYSIDFCDCRSLCVFGGIYIHNNGTKLKLYILRKHVLEKRHAKIFSFNVQLKCNKLSFLLGFLVLPKIGNLN